MKINVEITWKWMRKACLAKCNACWNVSSWDATDFVGSRWRHSSYKSINCGGGGEAVFDTLGKWECAHRAGGPTPYKGWVPSFAVGGRGKMPPPLTHRKRGKKSLFCGGWEGETPPSPLPPPTHRKRGNSPLIRGGPSSTVGTLPFP